MTFRDDTSLLVLLLSYSHSILFLMIQMSSSVSPQTIFLGNTVVSLQGTSSNLAPFQSVLYTMRTHYQRAVLQMLFLYLTLSAPHEGLQVMLRYWRNIKPVTPWKNLSSSPPDSHPLVSPVSCLLPNLHLSRSFPRSCWAFRSHLWQLKSFSSFFTITVLYLLSFQT